MSDDVLSYIFAPNHRPRSPEKTKRFGQRSGAFSHSAFVNVMPGQVPVTFGIQAGLGLNVFGKKRTGGE